LRDIPVNAMGIDLATDVGERVGRGEADATAPPVLLDPTGGREDLAARLLRAPGAPAERFAEDPLRVVRLARFVSQLGFEVEPATLDAARSAAPALAGVAVERVRDELTKLLLGRYPAQGLRVALETGTLAVVLPEVAAMDGVTQPTFHDLDVFAHTVQAVSLVPPTHALRWAALLHDVGKVPARSVEPDGRIRFFGHPRIGARIAEEVCQRLRMSNAQIASIVHLVREHMRLGDLHVHNRRAVDRAVRRLDLWERGSARDRPLVSAEDAVALAVADFGATAARERTSEVRSVLEGVIAASRERGTGTRPRPVLSGTQVMKELGLAEGPQIGAAVRAVDEAVAAGRLGPGDHREAIEIARRAAERHREAAQDS
jgi:putative nucleotidyltransferase with HDIG domain